jgi:two-component system sensor histidine kinase HydH
VSETLRLETLVNDLLAYAKSDPGSISTVNVREVIAHSAELLRHEADQLNVKVVYDCLDGILITGNEDRLSQLLLNLGKNALQAMPDGGTLRITAGTDSKKVMISVFDDGQGIRQEDMGRIFEPFFTTKARGTGLGLALCKKIVEEHGGKITVQSVVGEGTTVSMTIPARQKLLRRSLT